MIQSIFFFFSSRRRHTRWPRDWSSDVCSSDLIQNAQYRPANYHRLRAGLTAGGQPVAWTHRIVAPSIMARVFPNSVQNGLDGEAVEGGKEMAYAVPNVHVDYQ